MSSRLPLVTLLTDFGSQDTYVGVLKGVIAGVCPAAAIVDLTCDVPPQDIQAGAFHLLIACPYFPAGSVHLAVVDPGVGTDRPLIAVEAGDQRFVGPDNGLLRWIVEWLAPDTWRAVRLTEPHYWRPPVSHSFHARDIMAPVAAHLAAGIALNQVGSPLETLAGTPLPPPTREVDRLRGEILHIDHFGNAVSNIRPEHLAKHSGTLAISIGVHKLSGPVDSYAAVGTGEALVIWGSAGYLELAVREGSAAAALDIHRGDQVTVRLDQHLPV